MLRNHCFHLASSFYATKNRVLFSRRSCEVVAPSCCSHIVPAFNLQSGVLPFVHESVLVHNRLHHDGEKKSHWREDGVMLAWNICSKYWSWHTVLVWLIAFNNLISPPVKRLGENEKPIFSHTSNWCIYCMGKWRSLSLTLPEFTIFLITDTTKAKVTLGRFRAF